MLEQIYVDFTTKLLPQIQEGLVISKDYFFDLFGRYIQYLIWVDSLNLVVTLIGAGVGLVVLRKMWRWFNSKEQEYNTEAMFIIFPGVIVVGFISMCLGGAWVATENLVKDVYIPEIRVIEELRQFQSQK